MKGRQQHALARLVDALGVVCSPELTAARFAALEGKATDEQLLELVDLREVGAFIHECRERQS